MMSTFTILDLPLMIMSVAMRPKFNQLVRWRQVSMTIEVEKRVTMVKTLLESISDGGSNVSAYDTAWVALVEKKNAEDAHETGIRTPQFPESLRWIADNQLLDGSWGDPHIFLAYDRIINTLACLVALKTWDLYPDKCRKGMIFFKENLSRIEDEAIENMPSGFETVLPSLLEKAKQLGIEIPDDSSILNDIYARRTQKLTRIPMDLLHEIPTTMLFMLEGLADAELNWEKLLELQNHDGSFLSAPSSTAFALMQTRDGNCLHFLERVINRYSGGAPASYPVDLFARLWVVDRLQRLGISRYFQQEIKEYLTYVHRYWTDKGIGWASTLNLGDLDDTVMGLRLLRQHGFHVSPDVLESYRYNGEFQTFMGQSGEGVTVMYNLFRASQLQFPGETIMEEARRFATAFLTERREGNNFFDRWIIAKDLSGEVAYGLDIPWYANLPLLETRFYIEHYGGEDDVWISKTLYRMPYVSNNLYLELAKLDYRLCLASILSGWEYFQRWSLDCKIIDCAMNNKTDLLLTYFVAAASIFEPERASERLAWAKTMALVNIIDSYYSPKSASNHKLTMAFIHEFQRAVQSMVDYTRRRWVPKRTEPGLTGALIGTLTQLSSNVLAAHGRDIYSTLCDAWEKWLVGWAEEGNKFEGVAELLVQTIILAGGQYCSSEDLQSFPSYSRLSALSNQLCCLLGDLKSHQQDNENHRSSISTIRDPQIELAMQELVQLVLEGSMDQVGRNIKDTYLMVVKSFYYTAWCDQDTIELHIEKVLYEKV